MLEEECTSTKIGLQLNVSKCELISCQDSQLVNSPLSSFIRVKSDEAILLGAPLLSGSAMDSTLNKLSENLHRATQRLSLITAHDSLIILRHSLGASKLTYVLRCAPCAGHLALIRFDELLRKALCTVINVSLFDDQWSQASLPIRMGGL